MAASSVLPGCGYQSSFSLTSNAIGSIPPRFMGLSYEKQTMSYHYFHGSNANLIAMFRRLGDGVLRIGGGSVDKTLWTPDGNGATPLQAAPADLDKLADFCQASGWPCLYGINLATSTPALAAAEVAYAASVLGANLLGIQIGNGSDNYGEAGSFFAGTWTLQAFLTRWQSFRSAILQAVPSVALTGPQTEGANHISSWTLPFGQMVTAKEIALLTQHYYRASGADPVATSAFLISPDTQLTSDLNTLYSGAQQLGLPYRLGECNSFSDHGAPNVSNTYASSLWVIDFLFAAALGGATGVNMHGGGNAAGYTPIADDSGAVIEARPEYYGLLLFALAGAGTLVETRLSAGTSPVSAYAIKPAGGGLKIVFVNKDPKQTIKIGIDSSQFIQTATQQTMTGPGLSATSGVTIQGATVNKDGSFAPGSPDVLTTSGTRTSCQIPALSAALVSIT